MNSVLIPGHRLLGTLAALAGIFLASPPLRLQAQTNCVPPPAGMVAWWKAEGDATDSFGTNNGTPLRGVSFDTGEVGQAFRFVQANNQRVYIPDNPNFQLTNSLTIEGWFKILGGWSLLSRGDNRPGLDPYGLSMQPDLTLAFYIEDATGASASVQTPTALPTGVWLHLAATLEGTNGTMSVYVNGTLAAQTNTSMRPFGPLDPTQDPSLCIGNVAGQYIAFPFDGWADEVGLYSRALSQSEIQSIFNAGSLGKCPPPPRILVQPADQTATVGNNVRFAVSATGAPPLAYQWTFLTNDIPGATNSILTLTDVGLPQTGAYAVRVSNPGGSTTSSNAYLLVLEAPPCVNPASNLISWWRAESNALDQVTGNDGTLTGNVTFTPGRAGQGFLFDGNNSAVLVGNPASLQLQNFTIETWIQRASTTIASFTPGGCGFFDYGYGGYGFGMNDDGTLFLTRVGIDNVTTSVSITDTNLHFVAVTKTGASVVFYIDAVAYPAPTYSTTYTFTTPAAVGARGDTFANSFFGMIDELSIYSRALVAGEVQAIYNASLAGKCPVPVAPSIISSPANRTVTAGGSTTLAAVAGGSPPLSYQWTFNGTNIPGATTNSFTLSNAQAGQTGNYSLLVSNVAGSVTSPNALVTVVYPPVQVRLIGTNVTAGSVFTMPVTLVANGIENGIGFSLSWGGGGTLAFIGAALGTGASGATLLLNTSQINTNHLGLAIALPPGATLNAGAEQIALLTFAAAPAPVQLAEINFLFGDAPTPRQLWDARLNSLAANFSGAQVFITPPAAFEGDVYPRPNGDRSISLIDWLQMGRYAARLDYTTNAAEFQRADCAPRATLGDSAIKVTDWVQVGRYAAGLDPLTAVGGPTNEVTGPGAGPSASRIVNITGTAVNPDQMFSVSVNLAAQGNENALGFSLSFDPAVATFVGGSLGSGASGATLYLNSSQAGSGRLGFALALGPGNTLPAGNQELMRLTFQAASSGTFTPAFADQPVPREISDASANPLPVSYVNGSVAINPPPFLAITQSDQIVTLSWPLWASNFTLQQATRNLFPSSNWTILPVVVSLTNNQTSVTLPLTNSAAFYRLFHP